MIQYMGIIVGVLETPSIQNLANICTRFLKMYPHLWNTKEAFTVNNTEILYLSQTNFCEEDNELMALFHDYNERVVIGSSN